MEELLIGTTDRSILVFIADPASTDGGGKTGLAHSDVTVSYTRVETDNDVVNSDVTSSMNALTNLTDAHNDWGWKEVSATLAPGLYRLDVADAVFATGAWYAVVQVTITTSLAAATPKVFKLVNLDMFGTPATNIATAGTNYSATRGLSGTALPNAAADAAGGLIISDAGGLDADAQLVTKINDILTDTGTTLQGELDGIQADTEDIQSRLPAALTAGGNMKADALAFSGSTTAADNAEIVFATDFADSYNTTLNAWNVNTAYWASGSILSTYITGGGNTLPLVMVSGISNDETAADNLEAAFDDTAGPVPWHGIIDQGTAQSATATTLVLRAAAAFADNTLSGSLLMVLGSTQGYWQSRVIRSNTLADDTAVVDTWTVTPSGTITYKIFRGKDLQTGDSFARIGAAGAGLTAIDLPDQTMNITGNITGNLSGSVGSVTGAVGSVTGNVGGNVTGSVGSLAAQAKADVNTEADTALSDVGVTLARMGALTDWIDGGRLDLLLDGVVADNPNRPARGVELANLMFMMVDATDLNTPEPGVTVTATVSKDGGAFAACTNSVSEVSGGWYKITLTATELTADSLAVKFTGTGCAQRNIAFRTQPT